MYPKEKGAEEIRLVFIFQKLHLPLSCHRKVITDIVLHFFPFCLPHKRKIACVIFLYLAFQNAPYNISNLGFILLENCQILKKDTFHNAILAAICWVALCILQCLQEKLLWIRTGVSRTLIFQLPPLLSCPCAPWLSTPFIPSNNWT